MTERIKDNKTVNTARATVDIICPTFDNTEIFQRMLMSVFRGTSEPFRFIIVNNGKKETLPPLPNDKRLILLQSDHNSGWMGGVNGGVKWALENDPAKYIMWINDDVQVIEQDYGWLTKMLLCFHKDGVGAVGPLSNAVMGQQSSNYIHCVPSQESTRLSGMCFLTKREVIEKVGLLDETLPGGDDLDYSIRVRQAGYKLCICRRSFLLHHYAATGRRVHGQYWDSREHTEAINKALIQKHGFKTWFATVNDLFPSGGFDFIKGEEELIFQELQEYFDEDKKVLDLGCGGRKIHPKATGVDIRGEGTYGVGVNASIPSAGEVEADATDLEPFPDKSVDAILAKHLFEHIVDPIQALREWNRVLKEDGKLVIVCPDYRYCEALACDPSHVHAFTADSVSSLMEAAGDWIVERKEIVTPGHVFMISASKVTGACRYPIKTERDAVTI